MNDNTPPWLTPTIMASAASLSEARMDAIERLIEDGVEEGQAHTANLLSCAALVLVVSEAAGLTLPEVFRDAKGWLEGRFPSHTVH